MRQTVQEKEKDLPPLKQTMVAAPEVMVEKPVVVERKMEEEKKVMESRRGLNWWREKEDYNNKRIWPTTVATKVNFQRGGILTDWLLATTYQRTWVASAKAIWMTHQWGRVWIRCDPLQSIQRRKSIQFLDIWEVLWIQDSSCSMTWAKLGPLTDQAVSLILQVSLNNPQGANGREMISRHGEEVNQAHPSALTHKRLLHLRARLQRAHLKEEKRPPVSIKSKMPLPSAPLKVRVISKK